MADWTRVVSTHPAGLTGHGILILGGVGSIKSFIQRIHLSAGRMPAFPPPMLHSAYRKMDLLSHLSPPWILVPCLAVKDAARVNFFPNHPTFMVGTSPLLEKERNSRFHTLIPSTSDPVRVWTTSSWTTLSSSDHPIQAIS